MKINGLLSVETRGAHSSIVCVHLDLSEKIKSVVISILCLNLRLIISCVILGELPDFCEPQFYRLENRIKVSYCKSLVRIDLGDSVDKAPSVMPGPHHHVHHYYHCVS